jgi:hypothetical protein
MRGILGVVLVVAFGPAAAAAQTSDFSGLDLKVGDILYVTDAQGVQVGGALSFRSPTMLKIDEHTIQPGPGLKIERRGDSLWNGTLIGAGIGVAAGLTVGAEACLDDRKWKCALGGAAVYAGIGALIDWAHKGRTLVYDTRSSTRGGAAQRIAPSVAPILSPRQKGVALLVSF